jgi:CDP-2,3-bis-(O-geranylgeranyl)-sn-glycerol synthase
VTWTEAFVPGDLVLTVLAAAWIMLPAWLPNPTAVLFGGGRPVDGGRLLRDGYRLLGDGKTWRGFFGGVLCGLGCGAVQIAAQSLPALAPLPAHTYLSVIGLSFGALLGDMGKSFFKRRLGKDRGASWPLVDQLDLVVGAFLVLALLDPTWIVTTITLPILIIIVILTLLLHRIVNIIGFAAGVKEEPW